MADVLIIEDESIIREAVARYLERDGLSVKGVESLEEALTAGPLSNHDLVLADMRLPGRGGLEVIAEAGATPVIIMTSYASIDSAVEAMRKGAVDYVAKPFDHEELRLTVERALREHALQRQNAALKAQVNADYPVDGIVGRSGPMKQVFERVHRVAPTDTTVLILGESGTGKELVARALHDRSERRDGPLIAVNCAAIPDSLIEAELFGHEKGAFTGADRTREGLIEAASGGTLFLDEIAELPPAAQARLLRVMQESEIRRVGASQSRHVDVRLIAATHRDLPKLVEAEAFREDLYFRINVMEIRLPPLRNRPDDIPELARFMLNKACQRLNRPAMTLGDDALAAITAHDWPGNVRELENTIERAVILADNDSVSAEDLALPGRSSDPDNASADLSLEEYFRAFVRSHEGQLTETELARRLGISRKALWQKRQRLGLPRPRQAG
jgi:DNA-binding NtrC family response regulator